MFFYLSFLRPPPLYISSPASIIITPQIANDLRTELYDGTQDIFYSWLLEQNAATKPVKLTSWRRSSAYKELSVPSPPGARVGQSMRLVLSTRSTHSSVISLAEFSVIGLDVFPVMSMPIRIISNSNKMRAKQEQVERVYRVSYEPDVHLTIREKTSFDLDKKVWDSGIGLSAWLVELAGNELSPGASPILKEAKRRLSNSEVRHVIELGAGTGIVSLTLGVLRSLVQSSGGGCIFTTDLPSAMPLLSHNISANTQLFSTSSAIPLAFPLDWDDLDLPEQVQEQEDGFDIIIMADVTYNTASFPSLIRTLSSLINHTISRAKPPPLIILGYKERDQDERSLWSITKDKLGITLEQVGECPGKGGAPIEFWIGCQSY